MAVAFVLPNLAYGVGVGSEDECDLLGEFPSGEPIAAEHAGELARGDLDAQTELAQGIPLAICNRDRMGEGWLVARREGWSGC
ncbi:hypothetical protein GCM10010451_38100 [Streptomyces virens]|uniref:Uncharacterized protein n=1 Tax=Streptomyces virens TaxID=285572 RepID=A0ABP6PQ99_9ACTN